MIASRSAPARTTSDQDIAMCRSVLYEALSLGFRPPTGETCRRLGAADAAADLARAAELIDPDLAPRAHDLASATGAPSLESLQCEYRRLFGHTARGLISAYDTEYGADTLFQKPQEMSDIAGFLHAFGLSVDSDAHERLDHISCELEFLAFLARKEAHSIEVKDDAMRRETRRATRAFLKDHLGRFAPSFSRHVMQQGADGFYGKLAALCLDYVKVECHHFDVPLGPETLRIRLPLDDLAPMACGGPDDCVPGPCGPPGEGEST